ncbi:MAG: hypothetical protein JOZ69_25060 [Myxococcales bacterium]|nr:hypothetical protein [Myxococcales bacterium]
MRHRLRPTGVLRSRAARIGVAALAVSLAASGASCGPNSVCKLAGPINDPSNRTLRRSLMSFGLDQFCPQMTSRNAPLKLAAEGPVIGRFFPQECTKQFLDNGDLWVHFGGFGYAWTNLSKKVTFTSAATIQYNQDFRCADDNSIYAYFDTRMLTAPEFRVLQIEQPVANLVQGWITPFADNFGRQMVTGKLAQGFTVIQTDDGSTEFDLGHLPVGKRPVHPFNVHGSNRISWESDRTSIYVNERDFIGPIVVADADRAIYLTMQLDGQASVPVLLFGKNEGDAALKLYVNYGPAGPIPYPPRFADVLQYGVQYQRAVPVPAGMYYVVIDNTAPAGPARAAPAPILPFGVDGAAVVNYAIQIGDAP